MMQVYCCLRGDIQFFWILCFLGVIVSAVVLTVWPVWAIRTAITELIYFIDFSTIFVLLSIVWSVLWIIVWPIVRAIVWSVVWTMLSALWSRPIAMICSLMITCSWCDYYVCDVGVCVYGFELQKSYVIFVCVPSAKEIDHLLPWPKWQGVLTIWFTGVERWVTSFVIILAVMVFWILILI